MNPIRTFAFKSAHAVFGWILTARLRLRIYGQEHIPQTGPFILVSNHCSHADSVIHFKAMGERAVDLHSLAAEDYFFKNRGLRLVAEWIFNALPIGRERIQQSLLKRCSEVVENGQAFLIFPEGTRQLFPHIAPFKRVSGMLAVQCGVPIIPARIFGSHRVLPKGQRHLTRYPIDVVYGKAITPMALPEGEESARKGLYIDANDKIEHALRALRRPTLGTALITGASSGIGTALATEFAAAGYDLIILGRDTQRLNTVAEQCRQRYGVTCITHCVDFADIDSFDRWMDAFRPEMPPIDILVNNAGLGNFGPVADADPQALDTLLNVNMRAVLLITRALLPGMKARGQGRILNIGSVYSVAPVMNQAVYGATKAFVHSLSLSLRAELKGSGISVTSALPVSTATAFHSRFDATVKRNSVARSAERVAQDLYRATMRKKAVCTSGAHNALFKWAALHLPTTWVIAFLKRFNAYRGIQSVGPASSVTDSPPQTNSSGQSTP